MKKKIIMLVAAAMMTLSASSAFAAFADLELIRVAYDRAGNEIATDLGSVSALTAPGSTTTIAGSFSGLSTGFVAYFALDRLTSELWVSGSTTVVTSITGTANGLTSLKSGSVGTYALFNSQGGTNYTGPASAPNSFKNKLSATQGTLATSVAAGSRLNTEASIASLLTTPGSSVTQSLYYFADANTTVAAEKKGVAVATITTSADGTTTINTPTAATPIPPAFFLMGSGLLGMFGLRRKNKVA